MKYEIKMSNFYVVEAESKERAVEKLKKCLDFKNMKGEPEFEVSEFNVENCP